MKGAELIYELDNTKRLNVEIVPINTKNGTFSMRVELPEPLKQMLKNNWNADIWAGVFPTTSISPNSEPPSHLIVEFKNHKE